MADVRVAFEGHMIQSANTAPFLRIGSRGSRWRWCRRARCRTDIRRSSWCSTRRRSRSRSFAPRGDVVQDRPLADAGGKGLFAKEIEEVLLAGSIDLAVHSSKDLPTVLPAGLAPAGFLAREDVRDAFISRKANTPRDLAPGATVWHCLAAARGLSQKTAAGPAGGHVAGQRGNAAAQT